MWSVTPQSGLATAVLDFTSDFSGLLIGLVGIVGLSAAILVYMAIHHALPRKRQVTVKTASVATNQRDAA
jgi:predicted permease